jgi:hypothetical protein
MYICLGMKVPVCPLGITPVICRYPSPARGPFAPEPELKIEGARWPAVVPH